MSTKTLRKRIALVAVASLGFGLMSTVPASALAIASVTTATLTSLTPNVVTVGTNGGSGRAITANVVTRDSTISLANLLVTPTGTTSAADKDYGISIGTQDPAVGATGVKTLYTFKTATSAIKTNAAFTPVDLDGGAAGASGAGGVTLATPDTIPATTTPTTYYIHVYITTANHATLVDAATDVVITMTVVKSRSFGIVIS
jgi:hypothetical protein